MGKSVRTANAGGTVGDDSVIGATLGAGEAVAGAALVDGAAGMDGAAGVDVACRVGVVTKAMTVGVSAEFSPKISWTTTWGEHAKSAVTTSATTTPATFACFRISTFLSQRYYNRAGNFAQTRKELQKIGFTRLRAIESAARVCYNSVVTLNTFLGTQRWAYKSWVGAFYPEGTKSGDYLTEYARRFRAVEVDSTYYGVPRPYSVEQWRDATPAHFRFTAKFPQIITHEKMLKDAERATEQFLSTMALLGDKLGPLLLQFPYTFKPDQHDALARYLAALPTQFRYAVEVRQRAWLSNAFFDLLKQHHVAHALSDYGYLPRVVRITTDFAYVRLLGNRKDIPDDQYDRVRLNRDADLERWGNLIADLNEKGVVVWGFVNNHYQGHSPATVRALMERIDR